MSEFKQVKLWESGFSIIKWEVWFSRLFLKTLWGLKSYDSAMLISIVRTPNMLFFLFFYIKLNKSSNAQREPPIWINVFSHSVFKYFRKRIPLCFYCIILIYRPYIVSHSSDHSCMERVVSLIAKWAFGSIWQICHVEVKKLLTGMCILATRHLLLRSFYKWILMEWQLKICLLWTGSVEERKLNHGWNKGLDLDRVETVRVLKSAKHRDRYMRAVPVISAVSNIH